MQRQQQCRSRNRPSRNAACLAGVGGLLLLLMSSAPLAQGPALIRVPGVSEPPELLGQPKAPRAESEADRLFLDLLDGDWNDLEKAKSIRDDLTTFIKAHPDHADAYFMRARFTHCHIADGDAVDALSDITQAIAIDSLSGRRLTSVPRLYAFRAQVHFDAEHYLDAMADLDSAVNQDIKSARQIFNAGRVEPNSSPEPCEWSLADFDQLHSEFPRDARPFLYRGLYFSNFATFDEQYAAQAIEAFQRASVLDPSAASPHYFIGAVRMQGSLWASLASPITRDEASQSVIQSMTRALALDPTLAPAWILRANEYHHLKRYADTIRDYDRVLALDPDNASAYSGRGLAKLELGQYYAAALDFGESIRRRDPEQVTLGMAYQYRAEAYAAFGDLRRAIADFTKIIELELPNVLVLTNIQMFRELYPEYDGIADDVVARKLWMLFLRPVIRYEDFTSQFLRGKRDPLLSLTLADMYVARSDTYLRLGDFGSAVADFNRVIRAFPDYQVDRWRVLNVTGDRGTVSVDLRTIELPSNGLAQLWTRTTSSTGGYRVQSYDINCRTRQLRAASDAIYDADGTPLSVTNAASSWHRVFPETIGEQLHDGLCSGPR